MIGAYCGSPFHNLLLLSNFQVFIQLALVSLKITESIGNFGQEGSAMGERKRGRSGPSTNLEVLMCRASWCLQGKRRMREFRVASRQVRHTRSWLRLGSSGFRDVWFRVVLLCHVRRE